MATDQICRQLALERPRPKPTKKLRSQRIN